MLITYLLLIILLGACPYGEAFVDLNLGDLNHDGDVTDASVKTEWFPDVGRQETKSSDLKHRYAECSNAGICNRETGDCECFDGYEGSSCQRMSCATAVAGTPCSGHGVCLPSEIKAKAETCGWEYKKTLYCQCDAGWAGFDCNQRVCPKGVDPLTGKALMQYRFTLPHNHTLARSLSPIPEDVMDHYYEVTFDDIVYTTPIIHRVAWHSICSSNTVDPTFKSNAIRYQNEIKNAIKTIPPLSQSTVSIGCEMSQLDGAQYPDQNVNKIAVTIDVEYTDYELFQLSTFTLVEMTNEFTKGECDKFDSLDPVNGTAVVHPTFNKTIDEAPNCIPKSGSNEAEYFYTPVEKVFLKTLTQTTCSSRGKCNTNTGLCECFSQYYGAACENSLSIAV